MDLLVASKLDEQLHKFERQMVTSHYKFGVLFVKEGQQSEDDIFGNQNGSPAFVEFLNFLAEKVTLKGWSKFRGGLDAKKDMTGAHSYFTTHNSYEIMFHVCTLLPYQKVSQRLTRRTMYRRWSGSDT